MEGGFAEFCYSSRVSFLNLSASFKDGGFPRSTGEPKPFQARNRKDNSFPPATPKLASRLFKKKKKNFPLLHLFPSRRNTVPKPGKLNKVFKAYNFLTCCQLPWKRGSEHSFPVHSLKTSLCSKLLNSPGVCQILLIFNLHKLLLKREEKKQQVMAG